MPRLLTRAGRSARLIFGRRYLDEGNMRRGRADWIEAVVAYRRALEWLPWRQDLLIRIGDCMAELGDLGGAVASYRKVTDPDHMHEATERAAEAGRRAGIDFPLYATGSSPRGKPDGGETGLGELGARDFPGRVRIETASPRRWLGKLGVASGARGLGLRGSRMIFDQVGALSVVHNGVAEPLFVGVVAIRARIAALRRLETVELWLGSGTDATRIAIEPVRAVDGGMRVDRLHAMNAWIDANRLPPGRRWLEVRADGVPRTGLFVHIAGAAGSALDLASSNVFVPSPSDGTDPADVIVAAPAVIRPAARPLFDRPIRSVLAMRVDQLGDVSASLPALARLRALFPDATLTMMVAPGIVPVVRASGLADEILPIALDYDPISERRSLSLDEERRVRAVCEARSFDLAVDLSNGDEVRPLLLLTGATYLVGFDADRFGFLDFGISVRSRDKANRLSALSHAATISILVEALATAMAPARPPVPRVAPSDAQLAGLRLVAGRYAVLHAGARHALNRWPVERFVEVGRGLLAKTPLDLVIFPEDAAVGTGLFADAGERVRILDIVDADVFDAILSNARLVVANDSGPKHLASVRGVPTVSVHVDRLNWNEWGQDGRGAIVSKRVPCTGCGLNNLQLCARDAVCVRSIGVEEVLRAALDLLGADWPAAV